MKKLAKILYISYDGLLEPLGQSQILSYMTKLSEEFDISILSFEKKKDWDNIENVKIVNEIILKSKIDWFHLTFTSKPYIISTIIDIIKGIKTSLLLVNKKKIDIVHARSDIAGLISYLISFFSKFKFIFDMRGFWADERYEWGIWKNKNIIYFLLKWLEYKFFKNSDAVISLTKVGIEEIMFNKKLKENEQKYSVIPTCTNLKLFSPKNFNSKKFILSHVGAIATRYDFQKVINIFKVIEHLTPAELLIINKGEHDVVKKLLEQSYIHPSKYKLVEARYIDVPHYINISSAGVFFPKSGNYLKGYFPTKLGEFLACGKPIICGKINDDVEKIIYDNGVGNIIDGDHQEDLFKASMQIIDLVSTSSVSKKCRKVAEEYFSNEKGSEKYKMIYLNLIKNKS